MKWNIFEDVYDQVLITQMQEMIVELCDQKEKYAVMKRIKEQSLFWETQSAEKMEEAYSLRYPGEVLERYEEKIGDTPKIVRSLAFALSQCKELFTDSMFVGNQYGVFLKKIKALSKMDVYLLGACYELETSPEKKRKLKDELYHYEYQDIAQLVYFMQLFRQEEGIWENWKGKLNEFLGNKRSIQVYGNEDLYAWVIYQFFNRMKGYRKKDLTLLKALMKLPAVNVNAKNPVKKWMMENGYSEEEIIYLNLALEENWRVPNSLPSNSITVERMALDACRYFLSGSTERNKEIYALCGRLIGRYRNYEICLDGHSGILGNLYDEIKVESVGAYQTLYQFRNEKNINDTFFYINLLERKWDVLKDWMGDEAYQDWVCETLENEPYEGPDFLRYIRHYKELTGKDIVQVLWSKFYHNELFNKMVQYQALDALELVKEYLEDYEHMAEQELDRKWQYMRNNMARYSLYLSNHDSYEIFVLLEERYGLDQIEKIFRISRLFEDCFGINAYSSRMNQIKISRESFSRGENRKLFEWAEQYVYRNLPQKYEDFITAILLSDVESRNLCKEEQTTAARLLLVSLEERDYRAAALRKKYYSEEELLAYQDEVRKQEEEKRRLRQEEKEHNLQEKFEQFLLKSEEDILANLDEFIRYASYDMRDYARKIICGYIKEAYRETIVLSRRNARAFFELLQELYSSGNLTLDELKDFVERMEENREENKEEAA